MTNKKKSEAAEPLHTIRRGHQVVVTIERRQANTGFEYEVLVPARRFVTRSSNREASGNCFFAHQEEEIVEAVRAACSWIRDRANGNGEVPSPTDEPESNTPS